MKSELVKCACNHCSARIEFETEHAGETIACPHCGMDTTLYQPQQRTEKEIPVEALLTKSPSHIKAALSHKVVRRGLIALLVAVAFSVTVGILGQRLLIALGVVISGAMGVVVIVGGAIIVWFIVMWFILWIVFPVFVYYGLKTMENLLKEIERNTRR
jgi:DNA-directed RNA polymerase subunit RPC12/RpoP